MIWNDSKSLVWLLNICLLIMAVECQSNASQQIKSKQNGRRFRWTISNAIRQLPWRQSAVRRWSLVRATSKSVCLCQWNLSNGTHSMDADECQYGECQRMPVNVVNAKLANHQKIRTQNSLWPFLESSLMIHPFTYRFCFIVRTDSIPMPINLCQIGYYLRLTTRLVVLVID